MISASLTIANSARAALGNTLEQIQAACGSPVAGPTEDGADRVWYEYTCQGYNIWVWFLFTNDPTDPHADTANKLGASRISYQRQDGAAMSFAEVTRMIVDNTPSTVVWNRMQVRADHSQWATGNDFDGAIYYVDWSADQQTAVVYTDRDAAITRSR
jgi:hypothetical protein